MGQGGHIAQLRIGRIDWFSTIRQPTRRVPPVFPGKSEFFFEHGRLAERYSFDYFKPLKVQPKDIKMRRKIFCNLVRENL